MLLHIAGPLVTLKSMYSEWDQGRERWTSATWSQGYVRPYTRAAHMRFLMTPQAPGPRLPQVQSAAVTCDPLGPRPLRWWALTGNWSPSNMGVPCRAPQPANYVIRKSRGAAKTDRRSSESLHKRKGTRRNGRVVRPMCVLLAYQPGAVSLTGSCEHAKRCAPKALLMQNWTTKYAEGIGWRRTASPHPPETAPPSLEGL